MIPEGHSPCFVVVVVVVVGGGGGCIGDGWLGS